MANTATVHNPTNFEPSDYVVVDYLDNKRPEWFGQDVDDYAADVKMWETEMQNVLGAEWRSTSHKCVHCGNGTVRWITATKHIPTGAVVVFGAVCTARLGFADKMAFRLAQLQAKAEAGHERMKVWRAREAFVAARPAFAEALKGIKNPVHARNSFVQDVVGKLNTWGSLSDRQVDAVIASLKRDIEKATTPEPVKGPAPAGKVAVSGRVVSMKPQTSEWGTTMKMLLQLANNSRVWLTVPTGYDIEQGDTVNVTATFTISENDGSFAFGSRPSKVSVVKEAVNA